VAADRHERLAVISPGDRPPRLQRFFDALLQRDGAGGSWLGPLLRAAPRGRGRFGELVDAPGWLEVPLAVRTETGLRGAFEYPAAPSRRLLAWYIDHPDELTWPPAEPATPETVRLRRALIDDDPAGVRERARDRAHDLLRRSAPLGTAWWRFEEAQTVDCVLMTDRLVVVVHGRDGAARAPATPWFPRRSGLVRDLEAAARLGEGGRAWGVLVLGDELIADDERQAVQASAARGAPHLEPAERAELGDAHLGALTWAQAAAATGPAPESTPGADA
jgi:hypothetical protein